MHTFNGTAIAISRALIALPETHLQQFEKRSAYSVKN